MLLRLSVKYYIDIYYINSELQPHYILQGNLLKTLNLSQIIVPQKYLDCVEYLENQNCIV